MDRGFAGLVRSGEEWAERGIHGEKERAFSHDPSFLRTDLCRSSGECTLLIIDVGGSHTKAAVAFVAAAGKEKWRMLFDEDNSALDLPGSKLSPIRRFASAVASRLKMELQVGKVPLSAIEGVGFVWSNALQSRRLNAAADKVGGVTGLVTGVGSGKSYRKGEFFTAGLREGEDIGTIFLEAMYAAEIRPKIFVIGNDTVFTLKATPDADGGMVASTGANATDVDDKGWIYNTEMGGMFPIPAALLSEGERILLSDRKDNCEVRLEDLIAGRWLPRVFEGFVAAFSERGMEALRPLARHLAEHSFPGSTVFAGKDITGLLKPSGSCHKLEQLGFADLAPILREIAAFSARRAGRLAGLMGYLCLLHPLGRKNRVVLSLDSTQALHFEGYLEAMQLSLDELAGTGKHAAIVLQRPEGAVTVPMKGLAAALAGELSPVA